MCVTDDDFSELYVGAFNSAEQIKQFFNLYLKLYCDQLVLKACAKHKAKLKRSDMICFQSKRG